MGNGKKKERPLASLGQKRLVLETPLGPMEARAEAGALVYLGFGATEPLGTEENGEDLGGLEPFKSLKAWLGAYFDGVEPVSKVPISLRGTAFQKTVWGELLKVPFGVATTYGDLGRAVFGALGRKNQSARAIGQAVGRNPLAIMVPCHRVLAASGQLGGYSAGLENKKALLEIEGLGYRP
ncbi:MAG: methylated-DNA--[protein]-cysteine S-methyltransferase [Deltaproteobacteria bacterium]|jgi:methylated-DNA-[protein]-cysteine S-methyltransferase|nr:methylated-DNA--[protein]-cysteine S-methyltransferase [Deltaproteobacteria bacterium]